MFLHFFFNGQLFLSSALNFNADFLYLNKFMTEVSNNQDTSLNMENPTPIKKEGFWKRNRDPILVGILVGIIILILTLLGTDFYNWGFKKKDTSTMSNTPQFDSVNTTKKNEKEPENKNPSVKVPIQPQSKIINIYGRVVDSDYSELADVIILCKNIRMDTTSKDGNFNFYVEVPNNEKMINIGFIHDGYKSINLYREFIDLKGAQFKMSKK